jgi:hypothetical protein
MKKLFGTCAITFTLIIGGSQTHSQGPRWHVKCPLESATTEITTPVPEPWWSTPQVGKLRSVKTGEVAGKSTLECGYWAYNTTVYVMREFPPGTTDCFAEGDGFSCH